MARHCTAGDHYGPAPGSRAAEIGAFYVNCGSAPLADLNVRLVGLSGPLVGPLVGIVYFLILLAQTLPPKGYCPRNRRGLYWC